MVAAVWLVVFQTAAFFMAVRSWRVVAATDVRLSPVEKTALTSLLGSDYGTAILTNVVGEFLDAIATLGIPLSTTSLAVPDSAREHIINRTRWFWICELNAAGKSLQTAERSTLNTAAEKFLADLYAGTVTVPPGDGSDADRTLVPSIDVPDRVADVDSQEGL